MNLVEIILIALGLSMDCFAVAVGFGITRTLTRKDILKMAFFFGIFQGLMPLLGWLIGHFFQDLIRQVDHWIAFGILAFIGIKMILQSFRIGKRRKKLDIKDFSLLLTLSVATSIDALATGIGLEFLGVRILLAVSIIALITFFVSIAGARIGETSSFIPARRAELLGGLILIAIGLKILFQHLGIL
ncbi:MAG TPA: manganese efflux pump MntP family protein [Bacteroidales bacterium]|nr:manganese efflux pump MntP family protein [Bacteroidales bacterium]